LRELIALEPRPMLSLYLDLRWADEHQRERVWLGIKDRVRALAGQWPDEELKGLLAFTEARVKQQEDVGFGGAVRFLSAEIDLALRTAVELPTLLAAGPLPLVRPLVAALHSRERAIVALAHADEVRIFELGHGRLRPAGNHVSDTPTRKESGGWSQLKMQHHRQVHIDALHREAAASIARMHDAAPARVLVGGVAEAAANLERQLPKRVQSDLIRLEHLANDDPAHELQAAAERALDDAERGETLEALDRTRTLALSGGRGALGMKAVIDALNRSRPMRLFIPQPCDGTLTICDQCHSLAEVEGSCRLCGGTTREVDACEGLMRAALQLGARIDVVDKKQLHEVAAELRF
jgi:hypothetical protein